jgi:hypothetical protein
MNARLPDARTGLRLLACARAATISVALLGPAALVLAVRSGRVYVSLIVVMTWLPAVILAVVFQTSLVCPRCGAPFFRVGSRREALFGKHANLLAGRCMHCERPI